MSRKIQCLEYPHRPKKPQKQAYFQGKNGHFWSFWAFSGTPPPPPPKPDTVRFWVRVGFGGTTHHCDFVMTGVDGEQGSGGTAMSEFTFVSEVDMSARAQVSSSGMATSGARGPGGEPAVQGSGRRSCPGRRFL